MCKACSVLNKYYIWCSISCSITAEITAVLRKCMSINKHCAIAKHCQKALKTI